MRISDWSSDVCSSDLVTGSRAGHSDKLKTTKIAGAQQFRLDFPSAIGRISPQPFVRAIIMRELDEPKILQSVGLSLGDGENHCTRQRRILMTENGDGTFDPDRKSTRLNSSH